MTHETQEMDIALHSLAFMLANPYMDDAQRREIEDVLDQMVQYKLDLEDDMRSLENEDRYGRLTWQYDDTYDIDDDYDIDEEEASAQRRYRQLLEASRWN